MRGYHDDLIVAYSQTLWLRDRIVLINDSREVEGMLAGMTLETNTVTDMTGYKSDEFAPQKPSQAQLKRKSVYGEKFDIDFSWLISTG